MSIGRTNDTNGTDYDAPQQQAIPTPRLQDTCGEAPREEFILFSPDISMIQQTFYYEGDVRQAAEIIARSHRGKRVMYAKVIATVLEPLPTLEWTDGRPAGSGQEERGGIMGLDFRPKPQTAEEHYRELGGRR